MDLSDVDLSDRDKRRIDHLTTTTDFDDDEAEAIVRFARVDRDDRDPNDVRDYVRNGHADGLIDGLTPDECGRMRENMAVADRTTDVVDEWPDLHPSVVFRHSTGRCEHDVDVDATTSPRITRDECREIREAFADGDTVEDIRADFYRSTNAVVRHVFGRCDHAFATDRGRPKLSATTCSNLRRAYRENEAASIEDVGRAFVVGASTAHRHVTGACGHDSADEPPVDVGWVDRIDESACAGYRGRYADGDAVRAIADDAGVDPTAVRKHVYGRCRHGGDGCDPDTARVDAERCMAMRRAYRNRGVESVASIIDDFGVSRGTFYHHVRGRCSHDVDVAPAAG